MFSWEYFSLILQSKRKETESFSFERLWNFSASLTEKRKISEENQSFLSEQNAFLQKVICSEKDFNTLFQRIKSDIFARAVLEQNYWKNEIEQIQNLSREEAIQKLLSALKINEKINAIDDFVKIVKSNGVAE